MALMFSAAPLASPTLLAPFATGFGACVLPSPHRRPARPWPPPTAPAYGPRRRSPSTPTSPLRLLSACAAVTAPPPLRAPVRPVRFGEGAAIFLGSLGAVCGAKSLKTSPGTDGYTKFAGKNDLPRPTAASLWRVPAAAVG